MAEFTKTYDPALMRVYAADQQVYGFMDGEFLSVEQMTKTFSSVAGAAGEVARVRSRDARLAVKVTLLHTSSFNNVLADKFDADRLTATGVFPFMAEYQGGGTLIDAPEAWIVAAAPVKRGKEIVGTEWEIECAAGTIYNGGIS